MNSIDVCRFNYSAADARILLLILLGVEMLLVLIYIMIHIIVTGPSLGPLRNFFDVDREVSIPTWFSSLQLFAIGAVLALQARKTDQLRAFLVFVALGFVFLSMDEAAAVHDSIYRSAQRLHLPWIAGHEYFIWMVVYLFAALVGLSIGYPSMLFVWRNFRREARWIAAGGAIFIAGGIGIEILTHYLFRIAVDARFFLAVAAEEFFEMAGVSVMLYGVLLLGIRLEPNCPAKTP